MEWVYGILAYVTGDGHEDLAFAELIREQGGVYTIACDIRHSNRDT